MSIWIPCKVACQGIKDFDDCQDCRIAGTAPCNQVRNNINVHRIDADPGTGDDAADGYKPGDIWINTDDDGCFICLDHTVSSAVWKEFTFV